MDEQQAVLQLGQRFRAFLVCQGLTFAKAADMLDVSPSMFSRLAGGTDISVDIIERILEVFPALSGEWLLTGNGMMTTVSHNLLKDEEAATLRVPLEDLKHQYANTPAYTHGAITDAALDNLQAFMDEALYLDRIALILQRRGTELLRFYYNLQKGEDVH